MRRAWLLLGLMALVTFGRPVLREVVRRWRDQRVLVIRTDSGEVRVASSALETLIRGILRETKSLRRCSARVRPGEGGVCVFLRASLSPGVPIRQVSRELQAAIDHRMRQWVGVAVDQFHLRVDGLDSVSLSGGS